jgi:hypothetical protein
MIIVFLQIKIISSYLHREVNFYLAAILIPLTSLITSFIAIKISNKLISNIFYIASTFLFFLFIDNILFDQLCVSCPAYRDNSFFPLNEMIISGLIVLGSMVVILFNIINNLSKVRIKEIIMSYAIFIFIYSFYLLFTCRQI